MFCFNPIKLRTAYGDGEKRWADEVDSYSEYLVRNKVENDILGYENQFSGLIVTLKFNDGDYGYNPHNTIKYHSQYALHARVFSWIAITLKSFIDVDLSSYFTLLRLMTAFATGTVLFLFIFSLPTRFYLWPFLVGSSTGYILFARNLYFVIPVFVLPLLLNSYLLRRKRFKLAILATFFCATLNFLCRYEFASIFCLLCIFPVFFYSSSFKDAVSKSSLIFLASIAGFCVAVSVHVFSTSYENGLGVKEATETAFSTLRHRTQTTQGVPKPFSRDFYKHAQARLQESAYSIPLFKTTISKSLLLIFVFLSLGVFLYFQDYQPVYISIWALLTYLSWYVAAYQHIMWHPFYDWLIYSLTIGFASPYLIEVYLQKIRSLLNLRNKHHVKN